MRDAGAVEGGTRAAARLPADFKRLWLGQTISSAGTQVSLLAFPLAAAVNLHATPLQMGALGLVGRLPFLLYPVAGVWVDRVRRRPVLIGADLLRAAILLVLPATAVLGLLRMEVLYALNAAMLLVTVWFDTAYRSFLPSIVSRQQLLAANSRLEATGSAARIAGPGLGGLLVQLLTAPFAVLFDAASFVVSASLTATIRAREPAPGRATAGGVWAELREGLRFLLRDPLLRTLAAAVGVSHFFWALQLGMYVLFLARDLHLPSATIGLVVAAAGPGTLAGSLLAAALPPRLGLGRTLIAGWLGFGAGALLVPLAPASLPVAIALLVASQVLMAAAAQTIAINVTSLRQSIPPAPLLGRVTASFAFIGFGVAPLGSLASGLLGSAIGVRAAELVAAAGLLAVPALVSLSVVRGLRTAPS